MALPPTRDVNRALAEGATDGAYKKVINNRGGIVEPLTYEGRKDLYDTYYGIHESPSKTLPDGTVESTPNYIFTRPALQIP